MASDEVADILNGYAEIGRFLRMSERQAKYRAKTCGMPVFRIGPRGVRARKSSLLTWLAKQEQQAGEIIEKQEDAS